MSTTHKEKLLNAVDRLTFGKYRGEQIKFIIEIDVIYIKWALKTITWFKLDDSTLQCVARVSDSLHRRNVQSRYAVAKKPTKHVGAEYWDVDRCDHCYIGPDYGDFGVE